MERNRLCCLAKMALPSWSCAREDDKCTPNLRFAICHVREGTSLLAFQLCQSEQYLPGETGASVESGESNDVYVLRILEWSRKNAIETYNPLKFPAYFASVNRIPYMPSKEASVMQEVEDVSNHGDHRYNHKNSSISARTAVVHGPSLTVESTTAAPVSAPVARMRDSVDSTAALPSKMNPPFEPFVRNSEELEELFSGIDENLFSSEFL
eukprot:gb/GECG01016465.1/.p1 GENE.gb/GECG01016465.1/~~gb/GECG01016465.1/.p1  ORF type:complete len:210 (+),score=25.10 gb/GECG01016465.1/:1-630(+)